MVSRSEFLAALESFDLNELDYFEQMQYQHHIMFMSKSESLEVLINTIEGDFSQLSEGLALIAESYFNQN